MRRRSSWIEDIKQAQGPPATTRQITKDNNDSSRAAGWLGATPPISPNLCLLSAAYSVAPESPLNPLVAPATSPTIADRLAARQRPDGSPRMRQHWGKLLFMHWPIPVEVLRPLLPPRLSIDTYNGQAWIAVVPFTMWGIRLTGLPTVPGLRALHELNVRTYVHLDGVPGVWFFSLDAALLPAVWVARMFFHLPYYHARMELTQQDDTIAYASVRGHRGAAAASFGARWTIGEALSPAVPESLAFFLTERYCLYAADARGRLFRGRLHHPTWPLRQAALAEGWHSTLLESHGLPTPARPPLLHYADHVSVDIWGLTQV